MKSQLFHATFTVKEIDPYGKKFDRVSRITALSETGDVEITLDVNTEIYPLAQFEKVSVALAATLSLDPTAAGDALNAASRDAWRSNERSLADDYDYVMFGKVYKYDDNGPSKVSVYASFGGLLLCISGDYRQLNDLDVGMNLYLLMKK
ncbi:hypothetical protein PhCBS80983_g00661 [Powellomyces hirtus]|uniref:DNA-directed RNA polymerases I, II, and III subunit RPABC3 n=1 Tax=Powellomyces hirtus TaxID=109895 RepID=A0A507EFD9_9FUNG|nr:hypothetical protein DFJ77DRAFT_472245 [Powellomyces hirtus]TPX62127.1 hypothetical protein PhCBS80983_g00661 [Powellomyces hirtus]